jgi:hypothetical protein
MKLEEGTPSQSIGTRGVINNNALREVAIVVNLVLNSQCSGCPEKSAEQFPKV